MKRDQKAKEVELLQGQCRSAHAAYIASFQGMTVASVTELRKRLRPSARLVKVVKNTLAKRAMQGTPLEGLQGEMAGTNALIIPASDPVPTAKVLFEFAKENEKLKLRGGMLSGQKIGNPQIEQLAKCPSKEVLLSKMLGSMKSPITNLVYALSDNYRRLVCALKAVSEKKQ